jgi:catechol 2,3-dioxygenase-like lactoylglutathione lyase family enzyme
MSEDRTSEDPRTAPPGPRRLRLGVADIAAARALWVDLLGGVPAPDVADGPRDAAGPVLVLSPALDIALHASQHPGPTELTVATDRLDQVRTACERLGLATHEDGLDLVLDDERFGGGELRFVTTAGASRGGGHADPTVDGPARGAVGLRRADHVCFAVADLHVGAAVLEAAGGWPVLGGDGPAGARALVLRFPHLKVEMLAPTAGDGPVARYLARRAGRSGIHHFTLFVHDVSVAVDALTAAGVPTVDTDATTRATWHETFLRPNATDGLLIQLARTTVDHREPLSDGQLADIHAGRYTAVDYTMRRRED